MDEDLAEATGEGLVALNVELLVAEEDDAMLVHGIADLADHAVFEILHHVDAGDLGAAGAGDLGAAGAGEQTYLEPRVPHDPQPVSWRQALLPGRHDGSRGRQIASHDVRSCSSGPRASSSPAHVNALT
jgi:hypothetical protein